MTEPITRPTFYENQIVAPEDLNGSLGYARAQLARHERYLHVWGIATGLELVGEARSTPDGKTYKAVTAKAGMAVDPYGREVVVPADEPLNENLFDLVNGGRVEADAWYPVFLVAQDEDVAPTGGIGGACDTAASSRVAEGYELGFGRLGDELQLDEQPPAEVADGPDAQQPAKILLGFVQWDDSLKRFKDVKARPEATGPRYAGVAADEVVARGGVLALRSRPSTTSGKPAVVLDEANGGELQFGLQDARGTVTPVFTVTAKGDVTAAGKMAGALTAGLQVESGIATDGVLVPLPKGITYDQVDAGQVVLHVHVTPRWDDLGGAAMQPVECRVVAGHRIRCRIGGGAGSVPGRCDYTTLVYVSTDGGGS